MDLSPSQSSTSSRARRLPIGPLSGTTEQVGGSDSLFSSFNALSGTVGDWDYLADYSHRQSTGQRLNGDYHVNAGDLRVGYHFGGNQKLTFTFNAYSVESGLAGLMTAAQFHATPNLTTTPADRLWTDRYTAAITYENTFDDHNVLTQKVWSGYQDLITRSDTYSLALTPSQRHCLSSASITPGWMDDSCTAGDAATH